MTIYMLGADANRYENLMLEREEDYDKVLDKFDGAPMRASWRPLRVRVLLDEDHKGRPPSDFPSLDGTIPVFSGRGVEALRDLLEPNGEILPLDCAEGVYYAFNVTRVVDALDVERSELKLFDDGEIMNVAQYELRAQKLDAVPIFKLPQVARMYSFVTDEFVSRTTAAGLTGFDYREIWSAPSGIGEGA